ncbi:hypothetical protein DFJ73DRAFT_781956 [Zopfochytrium polystomum]|nr:hypothetical protein DFJ73DRAFT_781956 [Zopfochytrium polystomum]
MMETVRRLLDLRVGPGYRDAVAAARERYHRSKGTRGRIKSLSSVNVAPVLVYVPATDSWDVHYLGEVGDRELLAISHIWSESGVRPPEDERDYAAQCAKMIDVVRAVDRSRPPSEAGETARPTRTRVYWCDYLCVDQLNPLAVRDATYMMSLVYYWAEDTVVTTDPTIWSQSTWTVQEAVYSRKLTFVHEPDEDTRRTIDEDIVTMRTSDEVTDAVNIMSKRKGGWGLDRVYAIRHMVPHLSQMPCVYDREIEDLLLWLRGLCDDDEIVKIIELTPDKTASGPLIVIKEAKDTHRQCQAKVDDFIAKHPNRTASVAAIPWAYAYLDKEKVSLTEEGSDQVRLHDASLFTPLTSAQCRIATHVDDYILSNKVLCSAALNVITELCDLPAGSERPKNFELGNYNMKHGAHFWNTYYKTNAILKAFPQIFEKGKANMCDTCCTCLRLSVLQDLLSHEPIFEDAPKIESDLNHDPSFEGFEDREELEWASVVTPVTKLAPTAFVCTEHSDRMARWQVLVPFEKSSAMSAIPVRLTTVQSINLDTNDLWLTSVPTVVAVAEMQNTDTSSQAAIKYTNSLRSSMHKGEDGCTCRPHSAHTFGQVDRVRFKTPIVTAGRHAFISHSIITWAEAALPLFMLAAATKPSVRRALFQTGILMDRLYRNRYWGLRNSTRRVMYLR